MRSAYMWNNNIFQTKHEVVTIDQDFPFCSQVPQNPPPIPHLGHSKQRKVSLKKLSDVDQPSQSKTPIC